MHFSVPCITSAGKCMCMFFFKKPAVAQTLTEFERMEGGAPCRI